MSRREHFDGELQIERHHVPEGHGADDYESDEGDAYRLQARQGSKVVAHLEYNHVPDERRVHVRWVESHHPGAGTKLVNELSRYHPDHEIETGGFTESGEKLRGKIEGR